MTYIWEYKLKEYNITMSKFSRSAGLSRANLYNWSKQRSYPGLKSMVSFTKKFNTLIQSNYTIDELWSNL